MRFKKATGILILVISILLFIKKLIKNKEFWSANLKMEDLLELHYNMLFFSLFIVIFISYILLRTLFQTYLKKIGFMQEEEVKCFDLEMSIALTLGYLPAILSMLIIPGGLNIVNSVFDENVLNDNTFGVEYITDTEIRSVKSIKHKIIYEMINTTLKNNVQYKSGGEIERAHTLFLLLDRAFKTDFKLNEFINSKELIIRYVECMNMKKFNELEYLYYSDISDERYIRINLREKGAGIRNLIFIDQELSKFSPDVLEIYEIYLKQELLKVSSQEYCVALGDFYIDVLKNNLKGDNFLDKFNLLTKKTLSEDDEYLEVFLNKILLVCQKDLLSADNKFENLYNLMERDDDLFKKFLVEYFYFIKPRHMITDVTNLLKINSCINSKYFLLTKDFFKGLNMQDLSLFEIKIKAIGGTTDEFLTETYK